MKKSLVLALVAVMSLISVESQAKFFGVKGGANFSSMTEITANLSNATGGQVGVAFNFGFGEKKIIALQPELELAFRNCKYNTQGLLQGGELKFSDTRLQLPVNLQAGLNIGQMARVFVMAGPYFSYVLSDDSSLKGLGKEISGMVLEFDKNRFSWGIGLGVGFQIFSFQLAAKYDFGLNEIKEMKNSDLQEVVSGVKERNLNISLTWFFL